MGRILHKGSCTNSGHYIYMVKCGDIWFECDHFNHFCHSDIDYMLFYKRSSWWKHLRGIGLVPIDATWRTFSITYFHSLLTPFLFIGLCLPLLLVYLDVDPVCFNYIYTVDVVPLHMYIVWFVIVWKYVRNDVESLHTWYNLDDESEHTMDY